MSPARIDDFQNDHEIIRLQKTALERIEAYRGSQSVRLESGMGAVQETISLLRNRLIDYYRDLEDPSIESELGQALTRVNTALSFVVAVEYPVSGIHRDLLREAGKLLGDLPGIGK